MAISAIRLENFKSFAQSDPVPLAQGLNVVIGRNNTGKSSFLDAIKFAAEVSLTGKVSPHPAITKRGDFADLVFGKDEERAIVVELVFDDARDAGISAPGEAMAAITDCRVAVTASSNDTVGTEVRLTFSSDRDPLHLAFRGTGASSTSGSYAFDSTPLVSLLERVRRLQAHRLVSPQIDVRGEETLYEDGENLIRVLNTLASSNPRIVGSILEGVREIEPEIQDVLAKLVSGAATAAGTIVERPFPDIEFTWESLATGTQQLILLLTFLYASPAKSVLLIEEPEIYLHGESIWKLLAIMEKVSKSEEKQILLTTHSPLVVEAVGFNGLFVCTKDDSGASSIHPLEGYESLHGFLQDRGLMLHHFLRPRATGVRELPDYILVVEGPEDVGVWREFLRSAGLDTDKGKIIYVRNGGWSEAAKTGSLIELLGKLGVASVPFLVVVEADDNPREKKAYLEGLGLTDEMFHILPREMEGYLINEDAIQNVVYKPLNRVSNAIDAATGKPSKGKLEAILKSLGVRKVNRQLKTSLAANLPKLPQPVRRVVAHLKRRMKDAH